MIDIQESKDTELHIFTELVDGDVKYVIYLGDDLVNWYYSLEELMMCIDGDVERVLASRAEQIEKGE